MKLLTAYSFKEMFQAKLIIFLTICLQYNALPSSIVDIWHVNSGKEKIEYRFCNGNATCANISNCEKIKTLQQCRTGSLIGVCCEKLTITKKPRLINNEEILSISLLDNNETENTSEEPSEHELTTKIFTIFGADISGYKDPTKISRHQTFGGFWDKFPMNGMRPFRMNADEGMTKSPRRIDDSVKKIAEDEVKSPISAKEWEVTNSTITENKTSEFQSQWLKSEARNADDYSQNEPQSSSRYPQSAFYKYADENWNYKANCGKRPLLPDNYRIKRIVGGQSSYFGQYPWQVLIKSSRFFGLFDKRKCGGVLITDRHVLTAAHCKPRMFETLIAVLGANDLGVLKQKFQPTVIGVKKMVIHRHFDETTFSNDIAVLELKEPVDIQPHIYPICLPSPYADYTGKYAMVSGWGKLAYGGRAPDILQHVEVPIIKNSQCQKWFDESGQSKTILPYFLCAGYKSGGQDSCGGDSGSPLSIQDEKDGRWTLVGTVSHGINCAQPNMPGIYMKTTSFLDWIINVIDY